MRIHRPVVVVPAHAGMVPCLDRHQRRTAPRSVLTGVEAFPGQGVRDGYEVGSEGGVAAVRLLAVIAGECAGDVACVSDIEASPESRNQRLRFRIQASAPPLGIQAHADAGQHCPYANASAPAAWGDKGVCNFVPEFGLRDSISTTDCNAASSAAGSSFPRLSARRRMPRQAFALKK